MQDRRVTRRELRRAVPPELFACQRQLSGQMLALACRWLLAGRAIQQGEVWSDDWDEANAFCNPNREAAGAWDHEAPEESLSPWLHRFYDGLDVWVASPYGLAGPYKLSHGGAQGDNQGVGYFSKVSEKPTEYLRHAVREGLHAEDGRPRALDPACYVPRQPVAPHGYLPEVAFSGDRRHFALTGWGLAWLMGMCALTCAGTCGSVQVEKLKVHCLVLRHRRLHYASGTLPTTMGPLPQRSGGFMLTGIPLVQGEHQTPQIAKAEASLAKIERTLYHLRPAYVLVLRIVLAYVVSALDYVYKAMPPCPTRLRRTQRAVDGVLTRPCGYRVPSPRPSSGCL